MDQSILKLKVKRLHPDAQLPFKVLAEDTGWDLITQDVDIKNNTFVISTGIAVEPPEGYYLELVARSSAHKSNLMLVNGVGIIDAHFRGEIKGVMTKVDKNAPADPKVGQRLLQLIPRRLESLVVVESSDLTATNRGIGGFGSTGQF